jgi:hypothetical protein
MRSLFNVTVTLQTPCNTMDKYKLNTEELANAMCAVLASKDTLLDLCKAEEDMLESAHVECEITRDGDATLVANAVLHVEAPEAVQLNKPMLTKAFKGKLGALGKLRVEKRMLTEEA